MRASCLPAVWARPGRLPPAPHLLLQLRAPPSEDIEGGLALLVVLSGGEARHPVTRSRSGRAG